MERFIWIEIISFLEDANAQSNTHVNLLQALTSIEAWSSLIIVWNFNLRIGVCLTLQSLLYDSCDGLSVLWSIIFAVCSSTSTIFSLFHILWCVLLTLFTLIFTLYFVPLLCTLCSALVEVCVRHTINKISFTRDLEAWLWFRVILKK